MIIFIVRKLGYNTANLRLQMFVNRAIFSAKQRLNCSCLILFLFLLTKGKNYYIMIKKEKYERTFYEITNRKEFRHGNN